MQPRKIYNTAVSAKKNAEDGLVQVGKNIRKRAIHIGEVAKSIKEVNPLGLSGISGKKQKVSKK